jgi:hypothetical protein
MRIDNVDLFPIAQCKHLAPSSAIDRFHQADLISLRNEYEIRFAHHTDVQASRTVWRNRQSLCHQQVFHNYIRVLRKYLSFTCGRGGLQVVASENVL